MFKLLYIDRLKHNPCLHQREIPAIKGIKTQFLQRRQESELDHGGFERGRRLPRNYADETKLDEEDSTQLEPYELLVTFHFTYFYKS